MYLLFAVPAASLLVALILSIASIFEFKPTPVVRVDENWRAAIVVLAPAAALPTKGLLQY
jgi:hypothetical protein